MGVDISFTPLGSLVDEARGISYGVVQPGQHVDDGVPIVRVTDIRHGRINQVDPLRVDPEIADKYRRTVLRGGELLLTLVGTVGETAVVPASLAGWNTARAVAVLPVLDEPGPRWVQYALQTGPAREYIQTRLNTTVQATLNLGDVTTLPIPMPPREARERILRILGALDDKIELSRKMNATLEAMARALFKSWFVDFDPVRAKAEGRAPSGMDAETAKLFPSEFVDSELGSIPKGWEAGRIGDVIEIHDSRRVPLSSREREQRRGDFPYYGATSVMDYVDAFLFDGRFVLVGEDGSVVTPEGLPFTQYVWGRFWVNNHAHVLTGIRGFSQEHLYLLFQQTNIAAYVTGAVQAKLSQGNMRKIPLVVAPDAVNAKFGSVVDPLFARFRALTEESRTLTRLRDELLPRLLSGNLDAGPPVDGHGASDG